MHTEKNSMSFAQALTDLQCILIARRELTSAGAETMKLTWLDFDIMDKLFTVPCMPSQLSKLLNVSRSSMSKHLKYLSDLELVSFESHSQDARFRIVSLTQTGVEVMKAVYEGQHTLAQCAAAVLTVEEQKQFAYLAQKVISALDEKALHTI